MFDHHAATCTDGSFDGPHRCTDLYGPTLLQRSFWSGFEIAIADVYLSTILDDYSRYIISWKFCTNMTTQDVTNTLDLALQASGCDQVHGIHKPRLLCDNGSSYVSGELADWLQDNRMKHSRGAPYHP